MAGSEFGLTPSTPQKTRWDGVSIFYLIFCTAWTLLVLSGAVFLLRHRDMPILRMRGIRTASCAVFFLHMYWISVQLGYCLGPIYTGDTEYWIMGTWFPLGVGLFQCANARFLWVARGQRRCFFVHARQGSGRSGLVGRGSGEEEKGAGDDGLAERGEGGGCVTPRRLRGWDKSTRMYVFVGVGMLVQVLLTVLMFLISRKWHPSFGIPGTEAHGTAMEVKIARERGWEWWPTVVWQVFWAWIFAPYILWKSRGIHDTHGWRLQTVACCLAGLPATPLWLIALYVPAMESINVYWIPPQWIAVSIMVIEIFTIFLPCYQVFRHRSLKRQTLNSIAQWETQHRNSAIPAAATLAAPPIPVARRGSAIVDAILNGLKGADEGDSAGSVGDFDLNEGILTAGALEHVLRKRPEPLQEFAALRDFSGENIAFLTSVAAFKRSFPSSRRASLHQLPDSCYDGEDVVDPPLLERFNTALGIYVRFVSSRSEFQINISADQRQRLEDMFERPAGLACWIGAAAGCQKKRVLDPIAPFDLSKSTVKEVAVSVAESSTTLGSEPCSGSGSAKEMLEGLSSPVVVPSGEDHAGLRYGGEVPARFDEYVFDEAADSIKYLVLTNTWPKFVKERRESVADSVETANSNAASSFGMRFAKS